MPPMTTHLVIGERVFRQFAQLESLRPVYGAFLLGCLLVDVNGFSDIDRSITHFDDDHFGPHPCGANNFIDQLEGLLIYLWRNLCNEGKAFVLGYYCHLSADEEWKLGNHKLRDALGVQRLSQLIPVDVILTEFDVQSNGMFQDSCALHKALEKASVPNVLTHVPQVTFQRMWEIIQTHVLIHSSPDTFVDMIIRNGATPEEAENVRQEHKQYHEKADAMIDEFFGGVRPRTESMINYTFAKMPAFWEKFPLGN